MHLRWSLITTLLVLPVSLNSAAIDYETARLERRLQAVKTSEKIALDGHLNEPAWSQAPVAGSFIQNEPKQDDPATEITEVRVLYDTANIYFGIHARDSEPGRWIISDLKKDFNRDSGDTVEIILDTFRDERNGYWFAVNPAGAKYDAQMTNEGRETNVNWDGVWLVKTRLVEDGWIAEIAIPFKTLKFRNTDVQTWGINFQRQLRRKNEDSFWSPLPRIYGLNRVSLAGTLEDLEGVKPGTNLRLKPYVVGSFGHFADGRRDYDADFGMDMKYGLTTGLTLDLTYNTDFAQVEADEQQINLSRFNLFFPEKREFFLENSGIFQLRANNPVGGGRQNAVTNDMILFHSRRIGLSEAGAEIPILGGSRLTGRAGRFEMGFLNIQQRESGDIAAANFTVARVRRNILANSDVGVMLVNKEVQNSSHFNRVLGVDANFRFGQSLTFDSFLAKSFAPSQGARDLTGRAGFQFQNSTWNIRSALTSVQEDFVDEMGFVPRLGYRRYTPYVGRVFRPESLRRTIRTFSPHIHFDYLLNRDGILETSYVDYHFPINFQNSSFIEIGFNRTREQLTRPFLIQRTLNISIPPGVYRFDEQFITARTDASRRLSGNGQVVLGRFYSGYKHTYQLGGAFRLNHKLNASFSFTHNNINLPQGHFKTNLLGLRFNYSFSTAMFLNAFVQYNSDARQWSSNIRFNLIHRPLSDLFVVYNERRDSVSGSLIDRALVAKFTYMIAR